MSKHTPGPWQHKHLDFLKICDSDGDWRGCAPIAQVTGGKNAESRAEARANARLIAAAPDLLEHASAPLSRLIHLRAPLITRW